MPFFGQQFAVPFFITKSLDHLSGGAGITWTRSDAMIKPGSGPFVTVTNTPVAVQSGWYHLVVTSAEAQADLLGISIVPSGTVYDPQNLLIRMDPDPATFYGWPSSHYQDAPFKSLGGAVAALTNLIQITSGGYYLQVMKNDGTTVWGQFTATQSAGFNPITKLTPA